MALLMKESNDILSSVYRATPNLFNRFMPNMQGMHMHNNASPTGILPIHIPNQDEENISDDENQQESPIMANHMMFNNQNQVVSAQNSPPALSPNTNELSIDQNCTPPSSSSSTNTSVSPLDFNSFVTAATSSTPVMSPLMVPTPKVNYFFKIIEI